MPIGYALVSIHYPNSRPKPYVKQDAQKKLDKKKIELAKKFYTTKEHLIVEICEAVGMATIYK